MLVRYLITGILAAVATVGAAIFWYRVTDRPRPAALDKVHEIVVNTTAGRQLSEILGITDTPAEAPVNLASAGATLVGSVAGAVKERVTEAATTTIVRELLRQYNRLPGSQQEVIKETVCTATSSGQQ